MNIEVRNILQLFLAKGLGPKTLGHLLDRLSIEAMSVEEFLSLPRTEMLHRYKLKPEVIDAIRSRDGEVEKFCEEVERQGIQIIIKGKPDYPRRLIHCLEKDAPPVLFIKGNASILDKPAVGFCGSRKASERGLSVAAGCVQGLVEKDINIVSGYAHGVDLVAHRTALEKGGVTTFVLVEGILRFKVKKEIAGLLTSNNHIVVSEFPPNLTWNAGNAMQRNRTICGLANVLIIIESGLNGGTFEAGKMALKFKRPLFVVDYTKPAPPAEGNPYFIKKGAVPLRRNRSGHPSLDKVFEAINSANTTLQPTQQGLFV